MSDVDSGVDALMAFRRGEDTYEADAGAALIVLAIRSLMRWSP